MNKAAALSGLLLLGVLPAVGLCEPQPVRGIVVDRDGQGIDKADVRFYGDDKREVGHARSDRQGRFSAEVSAPPETWSVAAKNFESRTLRFSEIGSSTVVLYP